jgi:hypothetical protein
MFEQMYQKLENELGVKRKDMERLIEEVSKINSDQMPRARTFVSMQNDQLQPGSSDLIRNNV